MKIYHASLFKKVLEMYQERYPPRKLNVLRSYGMRDKEDHAYRTTHRNRCSSICRDGGTYTLYNSIHPPTRPITLEGYIQEMLEYKDDYDWYANYDKCFVGDCFELNIANQVRMEREGLHPVPVIHDIFGEEVDYYIEEGYEMIAVGSPQLTNEKTLEYLMRRFENTRVRIHLFATTKWDYLTQFPIYSSDTSTWARMSGYGHIYWWNPHKTGEYKGETVYLQEFMHKAKRHPNSFRTHPLRTEIEKYLDETLGVTYENILGSEGAYYKYLVNVHYFVELERRINEEQRKRGFFTANL